MFLGFKYGILVFRFLFYFNLIKLMNYLNFIFKFECELLTINVIIKAGNIHQFRSIQVSSSTATAPWIYIVCQLQYAGCSSRLKVGT